MAESGRETHVSQRAAKMFMSQLHLRACAHYATGLPERHIMVANIDMFVYGLYCFAQLKVVHATKRAKLSQ